MKKILAATALFLLFSQASYAETAVGLGIGTLGAKLHFSQSLSEDFSLRLEYNGANIDTEGEAESTTVVDGIDYDVELELSSFSLLLDWHPFNNTFRFTAGGLINDNRIRAESDIGNNDVEIGDQVFTAAQVGQVRGDITFDSFAPYFGIGWGRVKKKGFSFVADIGVAFQGEPEAELESFGGTLSNNQVLLDEIDREEAELQEDLDDFELYPVLSVGFSYTF